MRWWFYAALLVLVLLTVQSFASSVTVTSKNLQARRGQLTNVYFQTITGPGSSTPSANTALIPSAGSGSYSIASGSSAYLWSPQFATSTSISSLNWIFNFWIAASAYSYVPVILTNGNNGATPATLQVKVTWNPSSAAFSSYEGPSLGNIRFCTTSSCGSMLHAWLESCTSSCTTAATSASAWVKITQSISNQGSLTIYMVFLTQSTPFDGVYWGEAPTLSQTYGQYDNGGSVFTFYDNFTGTGGPSTTNWSTASYGTGATFSTNNMLVITCGAHSAYNAAVVEKTAISAPSVAEANIVSQSGSQFTDLGVGSGWDSTTNGVANNGYTISWNGQSGAQFDRFWVDSSGTRTLVDTTAAGSITSFPAGTWGDTWAATGSEVAHDGVGSPGTFTETNMVVTLPASYVMVIGEASSSGAAGTVNVQWARMRAFPPGNALPFVSFGSFSSNLASVSIFVTTSTGTPVGGGTIASGVQSPTLGTSESMLGISFPGTAVAIPVNGYISVVITASVGTTVYWGSGQQTDFQVPMKVAT